MSETFISVAKHWQITVKTEGGGMECTLQRDTLQERRKGLLINFQRSSIYCISLQYMIYQTAWILGITRQNINQATKPI